jgi:hypothetical protein
MSAVDIGSMGNLAPGPQPQPGRIVGLIPALHAASDIGAPLIAAALERRKWMKDYNDAKVSQTAGTSANGQVVRGSPRAQTQKP